METITYFIDRKVFSIIKTEYNKKQIEIYRRDVVFRKNKGTQFYPIYDTIEITQLKYLIINATT
jgi:hypothetical protein